jgi:hypothetical protein
MRQDGGYALSVVLCQRKARRRACGAKERAMGFRDLTIATAMAAALLEPLGAQAFDDLKYPDLKGQWRQVAVPTGLPYISLQYDPHKPGGRGQQAPLTPEYEAIFEANMADQALGGQAGDPTYKCLPLGMPRFMGVYSAGMEIVVVPETTYVLIDYIHDNRRIYTDGRDFPSDMADNPQFNGYSIGRWVDEDGDGRYDALIVETRAMKGPRVYENTGIPLHADNQTIIRERIYLDKTDPNMLHDEITTIDHALTRPWMVVTISDEIYFLSGDGFLMPSKKDQPPPDLRYFREYQR